MRATDFAEALRPIWLAKPETVSRVKQRCDTVMNWCAARDIIVASPLKVVTALLPAQPGKRERVEHHPSVPWRELPAMCRTLFRDKPETIGQLLLEFVILTACRSGEARGMTWSEIDQAKAIAPASATETTSCGLHHGDPRLLPTKRPAASQAPAIAPYPRRASGGDAQSG